MIDYCVEFIVIDDNLCENSSHSPLKWFQLNSFGEMCLLEENFEQMQKKKKKMNFEKFESVLHMKSLSMPLETGRNI